jgi:isoleucyl-tRNA synthetase
MDSTEQAYYSSIILESTCLRKAHISCGQAPEAKREPCWNQLPIKDIKNEYLIVWTTTPWTIPYNEAVMVNPELDYVKAKVDNEIWIVAKALTAFISAVANKKFTIVDEFNCLAYDTWGYLGWFGGLNKGRPNDKDLSDAEESAKRLKSMIA